MRRGKWAVFGEAVLLSDVTRGAEHFGIGNYSTVSWSCRGVETQMAKEKKFRDRIEQIVASIN